MLPFGALVAISGIFYPITHLPGWLQGIGQLFPMYWLGLGMRAALLPSHLAAVEIDGSWRLPLVSSPWPCGRCSGSPRPRRCCAGWRGASRGRGWRSGASGLCCGRHEQVTR